MADQGSPAEGFDRMARQYWSQWGEMMRTATPAQPQAPGWEQALDWWSQLARGGNPGADEAVSRFDAQARGWFGRMQQVAAQFAVRDANPADIAQAWKNALGAQAGGPFVEMFRGMGGQGQHGIEQWFEQVAPLMRSMQPPWQADVRSGLGLPAFGFAREHQERWQQLLQAQIDAQEQSTGYYTLLAEAGQEAFVRFERKLGEHGEPGRQLTSARALFDLWIDAAEEAYAEIALSPRFRDAYAAMVNAQMRLRARVQEEVEKFGDLAGMPTRTEVDSAHRRIAELERELRRLREQLQARDHDEAAVKKPPARSRARSTSAKSTAAKTTAAKSKPAKSKAPKSKPAKSKPAKAAKRQPSKKSAASKAARTRKGQR